MRLRIGTAAVASKSGHTRCVETQLLDECGKAAGVAIQAEPFRRVA